MKSTNIKKLTQFANKLDQMGLVKEANKIDTFVKKLAASSVVPNPKYTHIFDDVLGLLRDYKVAPQIIDAVQQLQKSKYVIPANVEEYAPSEAKAHFVPEDARALAMGYAQYHDSVKEIEKEIEQAKTPEEATALKYDLEYDKKELHDKWLKLMELKKHNPQVFEKLQEYMDYILQKKLPEVRLLSDRRSKERRNRRG